MSQIVSEISLSVQFDISEEQRNRLICSSNGLLQWMGLNAIERQLEDPEGGVTALQLINSFTYPDRVRALGWMVHHAAENPNKVDIYNGLVAALHESLPTTNDVKLSISFQDVTSLTIPQKLWTIIEETPGWFNVLRNQAERQAI